MTPLIIIVALLAIAAIGAWGLSRRNLARKLTEQRARAESERLATETRLAAEKAMAEAKARDEARQQAEAEERSRKETEAKETSRLAEERRLAAEKLAAEAEAKRRTEEKALADAQVREAVRLKAEIETKQRAEAEEREKARLAAEEEQRAEERRQAEERARVETEAGERARIAAEEEARRRAEEKAAAEKTVSKPGDISPAGLTNEAAESAKKPSTEGARAVRMKRKPGRYRGLRRRPTIATAINNSGASAPPGNRTGLANFRVLVQLTFAPRGGGVKAVRLIPYCSRAAPQELDVIDTDTEDVLRFTKLRDDCFTPIALADVSEALAKGVRLIERSDSPNWCWALGGRSLYVFAPGDGFGFSGFVSTECLWLNHRHVVMLKSELRDKVSAALREAGCSTFDILDETSSGVPQGWLVFKDVSPTQPVPRREDDPVFNALCPLPDIKPDFVGGIRLERNTWLAGYPPRIRFTGEFANGFEVKIDDVPAQPASDGAFEVPGWDSEGEHRLWFGDRAETYLLCTMRENWSHWHAHDFGTGAAICGASTCQADATLRRQVRVPASNPLLIGARPGEIFCCYSRNDIRCESLLAMVSFEPVWALPLDPAHADKQSARILLLHPTQPQNDVRVPMGNRAANRKLAAWSAAIREAGCKGLRLTQEDEQTKALWHRYRVTARQLRRKMR